MTEYTESLGLPGADWDEHSKAAYAAFKAEESAKSIETPTWLNQPKVAIEDVLSLLDRLEKDASASRG